MRAARGTIAIAQPYNWDRLLAFLRPREIPELETVGADSYQAVLKLPGGAPVVISVEYSAERSAISYAVAHASPDVGSTGRVSPNSVSAADHRFVRTLVARMFDTGADSNVIGGIVGRDSLVGPLIDRRPGIRIPGCLNPFEFLIRVIIGQQVSVRSATTTTRTLVRLAGTALPARSAGAAHAKGPTGGAVPRYLFPTAAQILDDGLARLGVPGSKRRTLLTVSEACLNGTLALDYPAPGTPAGAIEGWRESTREALLALPGVGPWTVEYFSMRALSDPDALPATDLVLRKALADFESDSTGALGVPRAIARRADAWRPWRSYATMAVWDSMLD